MLAFTVPGLQTSLAEQVLALGKPTVLVLIHGGAMSLGPLKGKYTAIGEKKTVQASSPLLLAILIELDCLCGCSRCILWR